MVNDSIRIDCDFPGGNVLVDGIEGDVVRLRPDRRDTEGWWFYWYFRVRGAQGRTLEFRFTDGEPVGVRGPAVSTDDGESWRWLEPTPSRTDAFTYRFGAEGREVRFCFAIPYLETHLSAFLARYAGSRYLNVDVLCRSRKGRDVELLRLGRLDDSCDCRILLTCRHHCCEMMASYALEGLMEFVLTDPDEGAWLREKAELLVVPFVDKDGVEDGDQGKNRRPYDHNRDYAGSSIYPEVRAIRERVPKWSDGKLQVALDLHCPWIRGTHNEDIYFVGSEDQRNWARVEAFSDILEEAVRGELPYLRMDNLPFGQAWNTGGNYGEGMSFGRWAAQVSGVDFGSSIEIPYANVHGKAVTADSARAFGQDLARGLVRYLRREGTRTA
jgi:hypothetical protein